MLIINKNSSATLICTLTEKEVTGTHWLFVFTSRTTNTVINWVVAKSADLSIYQYRYNKFTMPSTVFQGQQTGIGGYKVYEQSSATNTDTTGLTLTEEGFVKLVGTSVTTDTYMDGNSTYDIYNG